MLTTELVIVTAAVSVIVVGVIATVPPFTLSTRVKQGPALDGRDQEGISWYGRELAGGSWIYSDAQRMVAELDRLRIADGFRAA
jgi:hypothetical protein